MYIRRITRKWKTRNGEIKLKTYYYWYKSRRIGERVLSECIGPATKMEYDSQKKANESNSN